MRAWQCVPGGGGQQVCEASGTLGRTGELNDGTWTGDETGMIGETKILNKTFTTNCTYAYRSIHFLKNYPYTIYIHDTFIALHSIVELPTI